MGLQSNSEQWLALTQEYLSGDISEADFKRLESILETDPAARAGFRRYTRTDLALREMAEATATRIVPLTERLSTGNHGNRRSLTPWRMLQAAAMVAMAAALAYLLVERWGSKQSSVAGGEKDGADKDRPEFIQGGEFAAEALAILTHAVGVEWSGKRAYAEGASLPGDTLEIDKGLLQIEFFSGATVVVEGPARFKLIDPMNAVCDLGKVRANVPHFARGFTIVSDELKVVDLGTEFGFSADEDGVKEVHVFDGEVTYQGGVAGSMPISLLSGSGIRLDAGSLENIAPSEMAFADAEQIASLASAAADEQHRAWLRYSEELKASGDVLVYYGFDNQVSWSRKLSNDKKMIADPLSGAIIGCRWAEGRWKGKAALEFKRASDRVKITIPGQHDSFSMTAWVRIDGFDRELNSLMLSEGWEPGGLHWQFSQRGNLILGVKSVDNLNGHYESPPVLGQSLLGDWIHLGVSYDFDSGRVSHFLNGVEVSSLQMVHHHPVSVPRGDLGNWNSGSSPRGAIDIRNLNGRMDEFLFFSSALDAESLSAIYEGGRPR